MYFNVMCFTLLEGGFSKTLVVAHVCANNKTPAGGSWRPSEQHEGGVDRNEGDHWVWREGQADIRQSGESKRTELLF